MWAFTVVAALVLFLSYRLSTPPGYAAADRADDQTDGGRASDGAVATTAPARPTASPTPKPKPSTSEKKPAKQVIDGPAARTRWGPVQVRAVIVDGRLTDVIVLQMPALNGRDREINAYAMPKLRDAAIEAQSADIDVVTGATVTSEGYITSLQAALDEAHLKG
jgi:uncharacterized protein with FMN-binding domain